MKPPEFAARRIQSILTPGITRRPKRLNVDDKRRVGGRVQAVVSWRGSKPVYRSHFTPARESPMRYSMTAFSTAQTANPYSMPFDVI